MNFKTVFIVILVIVAIVYISQTGSLVPGGYTKSWSSSYENNEYTFSFSGNYQSSGGGNTNVRFDANGCYQISLYSETDCKENTIPVDETTCQALGGTICKCMSRECYQQKFCNFQSINFNDYVIKSELSNSPDVTFDLENFKKTKTMTICNNGETQLSSYSMNVVLSKDFDVQAYEFKDNSCSPITVKKSVSDKYYQTSDECNSKIITSSNKVLSSNPGEETKSFLQKIIDSISGIFNKIKEIFGI
jgi:hypothetical protein